MPRDKEAIRVVCYAVNGTGVGHITRLLSIARWLRRHAAAADRKLEVWFLTSSEADGLVFAEGFAAFKIPSKTIVAETGIDRTAYLALAKQWIWHTLGLLRPDLLIVDTFPRGSFGELLGAMDLCRSTAFVYRPVKAAVAERADFQAMLSLYDLVVVPEADTPVLTPPGMDGKLVHVGPVLGRERWELYSRDEARARLGLTDDARRCVYVSAGGGGDRHAEQQLERTVRALSADPSLAVVVGTGPLYRGRPLPGVTTLTTRSADYLLGFDAAVCAAGYNTFGELMFAGVPTAFLPQEKLADDQAARAARAVAAGAGALLGDEDDAATVVRELLSRGEAAREAARGVVPENGARVAAAELMRLVLPAAQVDVAEETLESDALWTAIAGPRQLEALSLGRRLARERDAELGAAIHAAHALLGERDGKAVRRAVDSAVREHAEASVAQRAAAAEAALAESEGGSPPCAP